MLVLLDTITTLAEAVNYELAHPEYVEILMPPLMHQWNSLADDNQDLFPLLEVLNVISPSYCIIECDDIHETFINDICFF
jgi:transportin-1